MANVLITRLCNRNCAYCFARDQFLVSPDNGKDQPPVHMPLNHIMDVVRFVKRSRQPVAGLMGGEPTLHPEFARIVDLFLQHQINIRLFTGGLMPPQALEYLSGLDPARIGINLNVPAPSECLTPCQRDRVNTTLTRLNTFTSLSFTLCDAAQDLRFLVDWVVRFDTRHSIRLGLGVPSIHGEGNQTLDPRQYRAAAPQVLQLSRECQKHGILLSFDCGFPRCMFTDEQLSHLRRHGTRAVFACSPIVDIGVDLSVWSCFPLAAFSQATMTDFLDREELCKHFGRQQRAYRNLGVYDACLSCVHKQSGECSGGCLAHVIRSFPVGPAYYQPSRLKT